MFRELVIVLALTVETPTASTHTASGGQADQSSATATTGDPTETTTAQDPWVILQNTPGVSLDTVTAGPTDLDGIHTIDIISDAKQLAAEDDTFLAGLKFAGVVMTILTLASLVVALPPAIIFTIRRRRRAATRVFAYAIRTYVYCTVATLFVLWSAISLLRAIETRGENMETLAIHNDVRFLLQNARAPTVLVAVVMRVLTVVVGSPSEIAAGFDAATSVSGAGQSGSWALVLAMTAFIIALAKFVDDHVITLRQQSRARDFLIKLFIYFEAPKIPAFEVPVIRAAAWAKARLGRWFWLITVVVSYWLFVSAVFLMRRVVIGPADRSYPIYVALWVTDHPLWLCYILVALGTLAAANIALVLALRRARVEMPLKSLLWITLGVAVALVIILDGYTVLVLFFPIALPYGLFIPFAAFLIAAFPAFLVATVALALLVIRNILAGFRAIALHIFDHASDPRTSPLAYLSAAIALLVVGVKAMLEI